MDVLSKTIVAKLVREEGKAKKKGNKRKAVDYLMDHGPYEL